MYYHTCYFATPSMHQCSALHTSCFGTVSFGAFSSPAVSTKPRSVADHTENGFPSDLGSPL